jgi:glycerol-3-phosphate acyltransferase PlsY
VNWLICLSVAVVAVLIGSFPTGFLVSCAYGVDIREVGSGNIGATNVLRNVNRWAGRGVFVVDALKGFLPTLLVPWLLPSPDAAMLQIVASLCIILGHNYTPWLGFKGGKGVAAAIGGFLAICWPAQLIAAAVWLVVFLISRYVSLASIVSVAVLPVLVFVFTQSAMLTGFAAFVAVATIVRHVSNIQRLLAGTEHKFEKKHT